MLITFISTKQFTRSCVLAGTEISHQVTANGMNNVQGNAVGAADELIQSKEQAGSPVIKVKDEPADDDEYEQALISPTSAASVKDEPNMAKVRHGLLNALFDFTSCRFVIFSPVS